MRWSTLTALVALATSVFAQEHSVPPGSPGYQVGNSTQRIQFDSESLFVDRKRIFMWSGEFHFWRLPVPALWSDVLEKMKAAGMNSVSIYINWGLAEGKRGTLDWSEWRDLEKFYRVAQKVGIYVVSRPGPYINAETMGGGFPGWLSNLPSIARTDDSEYLEAWHKFIKEWAAITAKYQYPEGPVIAVQSENEFYESGDVNPRATQYIAILNKAIRDGGISKVPIMHNDVYPRGAFASGPGRVDIYGFDSYPAGFDCSQPEAWKEVAGYYTPQLKSVAPWSPMWFPEFQGGAFTPWGGVPSEQCHQLTDHRFADVFYKHNLAAGSRTINYYMFFGGTNWGNIGYPGSGTSYDYGAAIKETRALTTKFNEVKLQGLFYQSSPSIIPAVTVGSSDGAPYTDNSGIHTTYISANGHHFYSLRQVSNSVTTATPFKLTVNSTLGVITIPRSGGSIVLNGRESKTLPVEYPFGKSRLIYSTAEVLTQTTFDGQDYVVLYVPKGQSFEALVKGPSMGTPKVSGSPLKATPEDSSVTISGLPDGFSTVRWGKTVVIVLDKATANTFFNPKVSNSYDLSPDTPSVIVAGPYVVRTARISGSTLALVGDTQKSTEVTVFAPSNVRSVTWNGAPVKVSASGLGVGLKGIVGGPLPSLNLPDLKSLKWKVIDSLPEVSIDFDDSDWTVADKTSTLRPQQPFAGEKVLYPAEYGFHAGNFLYRGYFNGGATGVVLYVQSGSASGFSAFLNGKFVATGNSVADQINATITFPEGLAIKGNNVLTVVTDSSGMDGDWDSNDAFKSARGLRGYKLIGGGDFHTWKLTGNLGGEKYVDETRGPYNEGGLWVERNGAHLPGYDYSAWENRPPYEAVNKAGVQAYQTTFDLNIPSSVDVTLGFKFALDKEGSNYRALIFVNGWQWGKFISNMGPQEEFPIPPGMLNFNGKNNLVLAVWALDDKGAEISTFELVSLHTVVSGKDKVTSLVKSPRFKELRK